MYADLYNVAINIFSIIPHGDRVEASVSLWQDMIGWMHSKITSEILLETVVVMQFTWANTGLLAADDAVLDATNPDNDLEIKRQVVQKKLHRMAKVHDFREIWLISQNVFATQKESHTQNKHMMELGYISDTEAVVKASWSNFQHDGAAAF